MCTSTATLLYGLWVTTASLAFAATAYSRLQPVARAIDLIHLRRRSGQLKLLREGDSALVMMPPEVLEQVKQQLLLVEKRVAELEQLAELRCDECLREDMMRSLLASATLRGARAEMLIYEAKYEWDTWGPPPACDGCWENLYEAGVDLLTTETTEITIKHIKSLLEPFGLCMPFDRVWNSDPGAEFRRRDFDSLSPISLPLRGTNASKYPQVEAEQDHQYEYSSSHAVANISPAIFDLPVDIHLDFASLVRTYGLEVADRTTVEILPSLPPSSSTDAQDDKPTTSKGDGAASAQGKEKKATKELNFVPVEPRWMLWSIGDPCI
ncbi:hypothetical protein BCR35DRAFT_225836 [Leucosporidium creatinivorum]|uniref:Uncharacterized protein n=1 Tax=Leucosporidium creatinivorum TaxID=106004 RepID=A0A1Y2D4Z9_9BASI|nr:hypothetical protein BCR35DRAFT_225836 [Leucosporidium creatinivorum]